MYDYLEENHARCLYGILNRVQSLKREIRLEAVKYINQGSTNGDVICELDDVLEDAEKKLIEILETPIKSETWLNYLDKNR